MFRGTGVDTEGDSSYVDGIFLSITKRDYTLLFLGATSLFYNPDRFYIPIRSHNNSRRLVTSYTTLIDNDVIFAACLLPVPKYCLFLIICVGCLFKRRG